MYKSKSILAVIPARADSKGIPNKNLHKLNGKPLIQYTFEQAKACSYLDASICSSDSDEIGSFAKDSAIEFIKRPKELALDTSPTIDAVMHVINTLKEQNRHYDYCLLLQPTSPLRQLTHINQIIEKMLDSDLDSMLSVHKVSYNPLLVRFNNNGVLTPILNENSTVRRQDFPNACYVNGALYLVKTELLNKTFSFNDIPNAYEMDLEYSLDINTYQDASLCENLLSLTKKAS